MELPPPARSPAVDERAEALTRLMPALLRRARRAAPNRADAEDLAQEALLRVWARLEIADDIDGIDAYLMVTLRHLARRRHARLPAVPEADPPDPSASAETRLFAAEVLAAIARLPRDEARMISAIALDGVSYADYARREGLAVGTVMSRLARSRRRLRERLAIGRAGAGHEARPEP